MTLWNPRLSAWVELPALRLQGLRASLMATRARLSPSVTSSPSPNRLWNLILKAQDGTELLAGPLGLVAISDTSDTWAHGISQFRQEIGRPMLVSSTVVEDGPVTRVTRQRARWQDSEIVLDIAQFAGADFVELRFVIDWRQHEQMLKLEIPTALAKPKIFAKVPGQVLERRTNGEEEPYQDWAAVQGKVVSGNDYTVALVNNSDLQLRLPQRTLPHCPYSLRALRPPQPGQGAHNDNNAWQDQGRQERRFWLMAGRGPWHGTRPRPPRRRTSDACRIRHGFSPPRHRALGKLLP
jgi:alpha-mannosidase